MEDTSCRRFFTDADSATYHRQYEAFRAIFIDGVRQDDVADRYGYTHGRLRQLVHQFRTAIRSGSTPPFFKSRRSAGRRAPIAIARDIRSPLPSPMSGAARSRR
jgi:hypothetical protein